MLFEEMCSICCVLPPMICMPMPACVHMTSTTRLVVVVVVGIVCVVLFWLIIYIFIRPYSCTFSGHYYRIKASAARCAAVDDSIGTGGRNYQSDASSRCFCGRSLFVVPHYTVSLSLSARSHNRWPKYYYMLPHSHTHRAGPRRHADNRSQAASAVGRRISPRHATGWLLLNLLSF